MMPDYLAQAVERIPIAAALDGDFTWIDVRSPAEYALGSEAQAHSIPIFNNEERQVIGMLYKQMHPSTAITAGYTFARNRQSALESALTRAYQDKPLLIFCARGGYRSKAVVALLNSLGYPAYQLKGGYKALRNYTLEYFESTALRYICLHGKTGVGKTQLLGLLPNALDLEECAGHRGSLFGAIGKTPATQRWFEARLLRQMKGLDHTKPVFIEAESSTIGAVHIPSNLFHQFQNTPHKVLLEADLAIRVQRLLCEYQPQECNRAELLAAVIQLNSKLSGATSTTLQSLLQEQRFTEFTEMLLLEYYDPLYTRKIRRVRYAHRLGCADLPSVVQKLVSMAADISTARPKPLTKTTP